MAYVDAVLTRILALLGTGSAPEWPARDFGETVPPVASWRGDVSDAAHAASDTLDGRRRDVATTYAGVSPLVQQANAVSTRARTRVGEIQEQWRGDQDRLAPVANTPMGRTALLQLGQVRIGEATQALQTAHTEFTSLAGQVETLTGQLPQKGGSSDTNANGPKFDMVDWKQGPPSDPNDPYYDNPPEPGGGYGSYHYGYEFSTREGWTDEQIMDEVKQNFNKYFTFTGDQSQLVEGATINLKGPAGEDEPVRVTSMSPTGFSFVSLPGHSEGAGRVIKFGISPSGSSPIPGRLNWQLDVAASGPLSKGSFVPGASLGNKFIWQIFANNLDSRLPSLPPQIGRQSF